jgi:enamine deaminase RidA (YjgF/YER057c/UK114 family)
MLNVRFEFVHSFLKGDFKAAFMDVLSQIKQPDRLIKVSVFFESLSDEDYDSKIGWMNGQIGKKFGKHFPSLCYVAQKPLCGELVLELLYQDEDVEIQYRNYHGFTYALVGQDNSKALYISGLSGNSSDTVGLQGNSIFSRLEEILKQENMAPESIIRQWNYIPNIVDFDNEFQHYQQFNDARTLFYQKASWVNGYPAATGIGTQNGPLVIDLIAMQGHDGEYAIKNPKQIDAHVYSEQVLLGENDLLLKQKSTPKFERAKLITEQEYCVVFVSGTAAIRGEESLSGDDVARQTKLTLENIESLVQQENLSCYKQFSTFRFDAMRVYIKNENDFEMVRNICEQRYPSVPFIYLLSDICRNELLVEIEAFVRCV